MRVLNFEYAAFINIHMKASDLSQQSAKATIMQLQAGGYSVLGRGASAVVLAKGEGNVIKVGTSSDGWLTYAKAIEGASNPFLPVIHTLTVHDGFYVAEVERLKPVPESFHNTKLYKQLVSWMTLCCNWKNGRDVYLGRYSPEQIKKMARALVAEQPELVAALKIIGKAKGTHHFDIHPDNIMKRANGQIVISDPLATLKN